MKLKPQSDKEKKILEEFISKVILNSDLEEISKKDQERIENFLIEKLQEERKSIVKEILIFLDELEMRQPQDLKIDNWRNWKYIRNSIVDKYKLRSQEEYDH